MLRRVLWGVVAVGTYVATALVASRNATLPTAPVFDGLAPPVPYRYVNPPADLAEENEPPLRAVGTLKLADAGSRARTVATADGQMLVVFADDAVASREGEDEVTVRITPLDPGPLPEPPGGLVVSGNAYGVDARYTRSRDRAELEVPATVVIRYAQHGRDVLHLRGRSWRSLETERAEASFQLFAEASELGMFTAAGVPERSRTWIAFAVAGAGLVAGAAGYLTGRRRRGRPQRRRGSPRRRRPGRT
ncbi:MAG: hypothetical protein ACRDKJ_03615 [Actinomycetota bacterium]